MPKDVALESKDPQVASSAPDCGVDLEVLSVSPVELGLAPEEGEDWGE